MESEANNNAEELAQEVRKKIIELDAIKDMIKTQETDELEAIIYLMNNRNCKNY